MRKRSVKTKHFEHARAIAWEAAERYFEEASTALPERALTIAEASASVQARYLDIDAYASTYGDEGAAGRIDADWLVACTAMLQQHHWDALSKAERRIGEAEPCDCTLDDLAVDIACGRIPVFDVRAFLDGLGMPERLSEDTIAGNTFEEVLALRVEFPTPQQLHA